MVCDVFVTEVTVRAVGPRHERRLLVHLHGCTGAPGVTDPTHVLVTVEGFMPRFYSDRPLALDASWLHKDDAMLGRVDCEVAPMKFRGHGYVPSPADHTRPQTQTFYAVSHACPKNLQYTAKRMRADGAHVYEDNVPLETQFWDRLRMHDRHFQSNGAAVKTVRASPSGWLQMPGPSHKPGRRHSNRDPDVVTEWTVRMKDVHNQPDRTDIPNFCVVSMDAETYSPVDYTRDGPRRMHFPQSDHYGNELTIWTMVFGRVNTDDTLCVAICLDAQKAATKPDTVDVLEHASDPLDFNARVAAWLARKDPLIELTYNGFKFDHQYLWNREAHLCDPQQHSKLETVPGLTDEAFLPETLAFHAGAAQRRDNVFGTTLSRLAAEPAELRHVELNSSAMGDNTFDIIRMPGVVNIDVHMAVKTDYGLKSRLPNFKLDTVAKRVLQDEKRPLSYADLNRYWRVGTPQQKATCLDYCVYDSLLPLRIFKKQKFFQSMIAMSRVTCTGLNDLATSGQQRKVLNQLVMFMHDFGFVYTYDPTHPHVAGSNEKYQGSTVIKPKRGYYLLKDGGHMVLYMDFTSLYPSIMTECNLCYSSQILDPKVQTWFETHHPQALEKFEGGVFVNRDTHPGVLGRMLQFLLDQRKVVKTQMKHEKDPATKAVLDAEQNALKISANSVYGATGATTARKICNKAIATSTTTEGRRRIMLLARWVESTLTDELNAWLKDNEPDCGFQIRKAERLYGDTDSIMILVSGVPATPHGVQVANRMGEAVGRMARRVSPGDLKLEKVCTNWVMGDTKKRYIAANTDPVTGECTDVTIAGYEVVRNDRPLIVRSIFKQLCTMLATECDVDSAVTFFRKELNRVADGEFTYEEGAIAKSVKRPCMYKGPIPAHIQLVQKIRERSGAGSEPQPGDRLSYVFRYVPGSGISKKGVDTWRTMEETDYAESQQCVLDTIKYVEQMKCMLPVLSVVTGKSEKQLEGWIKAAKDRAYRYCAARQSRNSGGGPLDRLLSALGKRPRPPVAEFVF
mgnify:CR=1 FL=1